MPIAHRVNNQYKTNYETLLEQLFTEWRSPNNDKKEPLIIEEAPGNNERVNHLYVIWSEWSNLTPIERSKLILQAYKRLRGGDLATSVTLAMGLTPIEAEKMNLNYDA